MPGQLQYLINNKETTLNIDNITLDYITTLINKYNSNKFILNKLKNLKESIISLYIKNYYIGTLFSYNRNLLY